MTDRDGSSGDESRSPDGSRSGDERRSGVGRTADEQAIAAMFTSLVQGAPPSEVSPFQVIRLARDEVRAAGDRRARRLKIGRNVLLAAAFAAVVVLVAPHLGSSSTGEATAASSASSAAAGTSAASAPAAGAAAVGAPAASAPAASSSSAAGSAAASGAGSASASASSNQAGEASSSAASSGGAAAGAPAPMPAGAIPLVPTVTSTVAGQCPMLPASLVAGVRAAFPTGYFGAPVAVSRCAGLFGATLSAPRHADTLTIVVRRAAVGECRGAVASDCSPVAGEPGVYRTLTAGPAGTIWVYGRGLEVQLFGAGFQISALPDRLIAAGRAVVSTLG